MAERALAHIEKVVTVYPIEGADNIEMVQVLDFHVVSQKSNGYKKGDLVLYIEVDSILPDGLEPADQARLGVIKTLLKKATGDDIAKLEAEREEIIAKNTRPEFEDLRAKKFRIKARKFLNKVVSQGIMFPLSILPADIVPVEGLDVTAALGITKVVEDAEDVNTEEQTVLNKKGDFEKFLDHHFMRYALYRKGKDSFKGMDRTGKWEPWMASQTDEENIQKVFTRMKAKYGDREVWNVTSKIEGQSMSVYNHQVPTLFGLRTRNDFGVCTHHRHLVTDDGSRFWQTAKELDIQARLKAINKNLMIQGEHAGGKIQGNIYKLPSHKFFVFKIWDIEKKRRYDLDDMLEFCFKYEFDHVPVVARKFALPETVQELLDFSNGTDELVPGVKVAREGIVFDFEEDHFKVKSPEYLILHGK